MVAEIRLDRLPYPIFLLHCFTSLMTHFKYNFWHSIHLFTDLSDCSKRESGLRELPISFNKIPLHGFALLESRGHAGGAYMPEAWGNTTS